MGLFFEAFNLFNALNPGNTFGTNSRSNLFKVITGYMAARTIRSKRSLERVSRSEALGLIRVGAERFGKLSSRLSLRPFDLQL